MNLFGKKISQNNYPLFVAELSCSHGGSITQAKELIQAAKECGADAVKIQCYTADEMTINHRSYSGSYEVSNEFFVSKGLWKDRHLYDLYSKTGTPYAWIPELFQYAKTCDIPIFSSVFGANSLSVLENNGCPVYKIASFENEDHELIKKVVSTNKPVILSTGMLSEAGLYITKQLLNPNNAVLMHCVSAYPCPVLASNLYKIQIMRSFYPFFIGFSDHTIGKETAGIAVALGAKVIEKHLNLKGATTEDSEFSATPEEFKILKNWCYNVHDMVKHSASAEENSRQFKRSLYVVKNIKAGEQFTHENIRSIRPSYGLHPSKYSEVINKIAKEDIKIGTPLKVEHIDYEWRI